MTHLIQRLVMIGLIVVAPPVSVRAEPLHRKIDQTLKSSTGGSAVADRSSDAEFFRRVHLDFAGDIPSAESVRAFLADSDPSKRTKLIDKLLAAPTYAPHMADQFSIFLMERRGENDHWRKWLEASFAENKPWDQMTREIIRADHRDEPSRGATFFYTKRLEKYGENPTDYPGLTRDVGRLFLGVDLQCAECHNHRSVESYKQADFQGLFATYQNLKIYGADFPAVEEGVMEAPIEFASVFNQRKKTTGPRIPGLEEITVQTFDSENAYELTPDKKTKTPGIPKFSPLSEFAKQISDSPTFAPNIANRLWYHLIGRGIVEPLDLFHSENPPSHPELLALLGTAFAESKYDIKTFFREIALTETYQRSGQLPEEANIPPDQKFAVAVERRLSAELLFKMVLTATGNSENSLGDEKVKSLKAKFLAAFAAQPREPELGFEASLNGALMFLNDEEFASLLTPAKEKFAAGKDDSKTTEEIFLQIFSRLPTEEERAETTAYLEENASAKTDAIADLIWAMLTSAEFATNH